MIGNRKMDILISNAIYGVELMIVEIFGFSPK